MFSSFNLWRMARPMWSLSFVLGLLSLISGIALLAYSGWFISAAALAGVAGSQAGSFNYLRPGAMIRLLAITRTAGRYAERLQSHYTILQVLKTLRLQCFTILSQRFNPYQTLRSGRFNALQQLIADIDILDQYPLKLLLPFLWAFTLLSLAALLIVWWQPALLCMVVLTWAMLLLVIPSVQLMVSTQVATNEALHQSRRREQMLEQMSGLTSMLMLGQSQLFIAEFAASEHKSAAHQRRLQITSSVCAVLQQMTLASFAIYLLQSDFSPVLLIACCLAVLGLSEVLAPLNQAHIVFGNYRAAQSRLAQLTTEPVVVQHQTDFMVADSTALTISELTWTYSQVAALSVSAVQGELILVRGVSGCGKSSLFATIAGDLPVISGRIAVQGPTADISWLDQHPYIFGLSIAANLRLANPKATDQQMLNVLALVELSDWLKEQKSGLASCFDTDALGMSGGELRRFALARCLLKPAPILLLDEPFAGLGADQASRILKALKTYASHQICLLISHQQQDASDFSQVIKLEHGKFA